MASILVSASLAVGLITARSVMGPHRAPYPFELMSAAVIYGGAGLLSDANPTLGAAVAWAYLVALLLAPSSSTVLVAAAGGLKAPPGSAVAGQTTTPTT